MRPMPDRALVPGKPSTLGCTPMTARKLDALDRSIVRALANNARLTHVQLTGYVPLSSTAIARRIRALEEDGVISGYAAKINHDVLGFRLKAVVRVALTSRSPEHLEAFEKAVDTLQSVVTCQLLSGRDDYMLTVVARDMKEYGRIFDEQLSRLPGISRLCSNFLLCDVSEKSVLNLLRS